MNNNKRKIINPVTSMIRVTSNNENGKKTKFIQHTKIKNKRELDKQASTKFTIFGGSVTSYEFSDSPGVPILAGQTG